MTIVNTLFPVGAQTFSIAVTSTVSAPVGLGAPNGSVRLVNVGPNTCFVHIAPGLTAATTPTTTPASTCCPVQAGEDIVLGMPNDVRNTISAICASTQTATLYVSVGEGV